MLHCQDPEAASFATITTIKTILADMLIHEKTEGTLASTTIVDIFLASAAIYLFALSLTALILDLLSY